MQILTLEGSSPALACRCLPVGLTLAYHVGQHALGVTAAATHGPAIAYPLAGLTRFCAEVIAGPMSFDLNGDKDPDKDGAQTPWFGLHYARLFRTRFKRIFDGCDSGAAGQGLANGRLDAENEIGEIRLTWSARMVAILVTDRPVGEGPLQAALGGI